MNIHEEMKNEAIINMFYIKCLLLCAGLLCAFSFSKGQQKPNVLVIVVDDLRPALGCYGDNLAYTPRIDELASRSVIFEKAYCQQAVCAPSRASFMTGLRPDKLKVWGLKKHFRETVPDVVTLPQYFKKHGYEARSAGKIYHDPKSHKDPQSWSKESVLSVTKNGKGHKYMLPKNYSKKKKGAATERAFVEDSAYIDGKVCDAALKILNEVKDDSFFLAVGFRRPHLPFSAPEKYWEYHVPEKFTIPSNVHPQNVPPIALHNSQELRGYTDIPETGEIDQEKARQLWHGYYASVSYIDAQIGKLLDELERLKLDKNTIIALWSDHGYHLREQGLWCKATNYDQAIRVPLIISVPGMQNPGLADGLVELVDLYPTLADLCHLPVPDNLDGAVLSLMLEDHDYEVKDFALSQFIRPYEGLFNLDARETMGYSLKTQKYRYVEWREVGTGQIVATELYNHEKDPGELQNIAGDPHSSEDKDLLKSKLELILKEPQ